MTRMEKRNTIQKKLVMDAVFRLGSHPTAEEVYLEVIKQYPSISKATVYRNLNSLSEDGYLNHIFMANGADRFDHCTHPHSHIECIKCGTLCDVPILYDDALNEKVENLTGYSNTGHELLFHGVCSRCQ